MNTMNNRVIGLIGIVARMANWNADFTGLPRTTSDGVIYGSDKALKYSMKKLWNEEGQKVFSIRSYKLGEGKEGRKMQPRELKERYEYLFEEEVSKDSIHVRQKLLSCVDVMNFGAVFAEKGQNESITGVVQIGQGFNQYEDTNIISQDILSPFRNSSEKSQDNQATSIGRRFITDEAHYIYPFTINPFNYDERVGQTGLDSFTGYSIDAYQSFKRAARVGVTAFNTNSRAGCENAFALFITFKEHATTYLYNFDNDVKTHKSNDGKVIYDMSQIAPLLQEVSSEIENIELYYNPYSSEIHFNLDKVESFNIFTQKKI